MESGAIKLNSLLKAKMDWIDWDEELRNRAEELNVWQFFDPCSSDTLGPEPEQPSDELLHESMMMRFRELQRKEQQSIEHDGDDHAEPHENIASTGSLRRSKRTAERTIAAEEEEPARDSPVPSAAIITTSQDQANSRELVDLLWRQNAANMDRYKIKLSRWEKQNKHVNAINNAMYSSLSEEFKGHIKKIVNPRERYRALEAAIKPRGEAIEDYLTDRLLSLLSLKELKSQSLSQWCNRVHEAYLQCVNYEIQRFLNERQTIREVLNILRGRYDTMGDILVGEFTKREITTVKRLLDRAQELIPDEKVTKVLKAVSFDLNGEEASHKASPPASSTSEGKKNLTASQRHQARRDRGYTECPVCKRDHVAPKQEFWRSCWTIYPERCKDDAVRKMIKRDDEARERLEQLCRETPSLKAKIDSLRAERQEGASHKAASEPAKEGPIMGRMARTIEDCVTIKCNAEKTSMDDIILDSGANDHIFQHPSWFNSLEKGSAEVIEDIHGNRYPIAGRGEVILKLHNGIQLALPNSIYAPNVGTNCLSTWQLREKKIFWSTETSELYHRANGIKTSLLYTPYVNKSAMIPHVSRVDTSVVRAAVANASRLPLPMVGSTADLWHNRLGHPAAETLEHSIGRTTGILIKEAPPPKANCEVCRVSTATRINSRIDRERSFPSMPFACISVDLFAMEEAYNGDRVMALFTCRHSAFRVAAMLSVKTQFPEAVRVTLAYIKRAFGIDVRMILMDNEASFKASDKKQLEAEGITFPVHSPYHPNQGGHQERSGGITKELATHLRQQSGIPAEFWNTACAHAVYLLNRRPRKTRGWKSPIEIVNDWLRVNRPEWSHLSEDQRPDVRHLRAYGCKAYVLTKDRLKGLATKLEARAHIGYLIGITSSTQYQVWIPSLRRHTIFNTSHVTFDETKFFKDDPQCLEGLTAQEAEEFVRISRPEVEGFEEAESEGALQDLARQAMQLLNISDVELGTSSGGEGASRAIAEEVIPEEEIPSALPHGEKDVTPDPPHLLTPPETPYKAFDEREFDPDDHSRHSLSSRVLLAAVTTLKLARPHRDSMPPAPNGYREAKRHPYWTQLWAAMTLEMQRITQLEVAETLDVRDRQPKQRPLDLRWVYAFKFDPTGYLEKCKARICVRGDQQLETYLSRAAITLASRTFRILMAILCYFDYESRQYDFVNAFLNAQLDEEVYTNLPPGFEQKGKYWKLLKALYGLRRAPLLWHRELSQFLTKLGFKAVPEDPCVMIKDGIIIFFYVDDLVVLYPKHKQHQYEELHACIIKSYNVKYLGELRWFLAIEVVRDRKRGKLWLSQRSYMQKIASRFCNDVKDVRTPLPVGKLEPYEGIASEAEIKEYQAIVGSIGYPANTTRPDVAFSHSKLAQFLQNPSQEHIEAGKHCISYLAATQKLCIVYDREIEVVEAMSDAAHGDNHDRKSSQGFILKMFGGPVIYRAGKQDTVTTSSTEAELLALSQAAKEVIAYRRLCSGIGFNFEGSMDLYCDNRQTIRLVLEELVKLVTKLRHVDIHNHWLRQEARKGSFDLQWIPTREMAADGLTKALPRQRMEEFVRQLGMEELNAFGEGNEDLNARLEAAFDPEPPQGSIRPNPMRNVLSNESSYTTPPA
ncbi:hypothetical protein PWT90_01693 [Aphanocladium album]|nr:hypothetical protein PWT90_05371 [Aphanocladium album]KAJ6783446.1 hypothetical protein PWT90_01693 [Aphanocladium album]